MTDIERHITFYYSCKMLKEHGLKLNFGNIESYEIQSRDHGGTVAMTHSLDELHGFCVCLDKVAQRVIV